MSGSPSDVYPIAVLQIRPGGECGAQQNAHVPEFRMFLDLLAEDSRLNVYAGELEVRHQVRPPPSIPAPELWLAGPEGCLASSDTPRFAAFDNEAAVP